MSREVTRDLAKERDAFVEEHIEVREALEALATGDEVGARDRMFALPPLVADSAHAHYFLALIQIKQEDRPVALQNFERAVDREPLYAKEERVLGVIKKMASSHKEAEREAVTALLSTSSPIRESALPELAELAQREKSRRDRRRVAAVIRRAGVWDDMPQWRQYAITLQTESGCKKKQEAIEGLAKTQADQALTVLREFSDKPKERMRHPQ